MRLPHKSELQALVDMALLPIVFIAAFFFAALSIAWCLLLVVMFTDGFEWNWFSIWAISWTVCAVLWGQNSVLRVLQFLAGDRDAQILGMILVRSLVLFLCNPIALSLALSEVGGLKGIFSL